ncbi:hypothetical protein D3C75_1148420 [compost metagenome]
MQHFLLGDAGIRQGLPKPGSIDHEIVFLGRLEGFERSVILQVYTFTLFSGGKLKRPPVADDQNGLPGSCRSCCLRYTVSRRYPGHFMQVRLEIGVGKSLHHVFVQVSYGFAKLVVDGDIGRNDIMISGRVIE